MCLFLIHTESLTWNSKLRHLRELYFKADASVLLDMEGGLKKKSSQDCKRSLVNFHLKLFMESFEVIQGHWMKPSCLRFPWIDPGLIYTSQQQSFSVYYITFKFSETDSFSNATYKGATKKAEQSKKNTEHKVPWDEMFRSYSTYQIYVESDVMAFIWALICFAISFSFLFCVAPWFKVLSTHSLLNTSHMFTATTNFNTACLVGSTMHRMQILTLRGLQEGETYFSCANVQMKDFRKG